MHASCRNELIDAIHAATTVEALHRCGGAIANACGFESFLYGASVPTTLVQPRSIIVSGYPQAWRDHYIACDYQRLDPTVHHCARRLTPLCWSNIAPDAPNRHPAVAALMSECRDFGLVSGVSLPVHGPGGEFAMLSMASPRPTQLTAVKLQDSLGDAYLLAAHLHEAARRVITVVALPAAESLSAREKECLLWSAEGKTSWETSQILGISERTVVFHLQHAAEKLGVANRQHAIARALTLGLITPQYT